MWPSGVPGFRSGAMEKRLGKTPLPLDGPALKKVREVVRSCLVPWFRANGRVLPWREEPRDSYHVWVSEIMLQQTRVETVVGYFERFMRKFPTVAALASASLQEVLKAWEGLGYYSRARNLHAAAKVVMERHGGRLPADAAALGALPGLGAYTTAAVASFGFGLPLAVLDGNVMRVLARICAYGEDIADAKARRPLQALADALLLHDEPGPVNEAWMELGALVCTPRSPRCEDCPMRPVCRAAQLECPEKYPVRSRKMNIPHKVVGAAVIVNRRNQILIAQRRPEKGMLAGLWEFPGGKIIPPETMEQCIARELYEEMRLRLEVGKRLCIVEHAYTHFTISLHAHFARILSGRPLHLECADHAWVNIEDMKRYPFSKADLMIIDALKSFGTEHIWKRVFCDSKP